MQPLIQDIIIDLTESQNVVAYANQYDDSLRTINCHIQDTGVDFDCSGYTISLWIKKSNGFGFSRTIGVDGFGDVSGNVISFPILKEFTYSYGRQECNLELRKNGELYSCNFYIRVNKAPLQQSDLLDSSDYKTVHDEYESLDKKLSDEIERATDTENALADNLQQEITNRTNADTTITDNLNKEISRAKNSELQTLLYTKNIKNTETNKNTQTSFFNKNTNTGIGFDFELDDGYTEINNGSSKIYAEKSAKGGMNLFETVDGESIDYIKLNISEIEKDMEAVENKSDASQKVKLDGTETYLGDHTYNGISVKRNGGIIPSYTIYGTATTDGYLCIGKVGSIPSPGRYIVKGRDCGNYLVLGYFNQNDVNTSSIETNADAIIMSVDDYVDIMYTTDIYLFAEFKSGDELNFTFRLHEYNKNCYFECVTPPGYYEWLDNHNVIDFSGKEKEENGAYLINDNDTISVNVEKDKKYIAVLSDFGWYQYINKFRLYDVYDSEGNELFTDLSKDVFCFTASKTETYSFKNFYATRYINPIIVPINNSTPANIGAISSTAIYSEDLNDIMSAGFYHAGEDNSITNKPSGIDAFGLEVIQSAAGWYTQILYASNNAQKTYKRWFNGNVWTSWEEEVTGIKGNAESAYRKGNVNLTAENVGAVNKSGDTMTGTLKLKSRGIDIQAMNDATGGHAQGMYFVTKDGSDFFGGIGAIGHAGTFNAIYISAETNEPWSIDNGLRITGSNIKWKGLDLVTKNSDGTITANGFNGNAATATKSIQDGNGNVITDTYLKLTGGTISGGVTTNGNLVSKGGGIEIYCATTPYIDFHYGDSTADYTSRIIESSSGTLNISGNLNVNSTLGANSLLVNDGGIYGGTNKYNRSIGVSHNSYQITPILIEAPAPQQGGRPSIGFHNLGISAATLYYDISGAFAYCRNDGSFFTISATSTSDKRLKNDMGLLCENEALTLLEKIMIHKFTYVNDDDNTIQYGAMAQDVRDVLIENNLGYRPFLEIRHFKNGKNTTPEISKDVNAPEEDVLYNMDYTKLIPIIWKGWQIHNRKIEQQQQEIDSLKDTISSLKKSIE